MTIVILGGTGVFGSRLARLLCRDGHRVVIAVRGVADAEGLAAEIGAEVLQVDGPEIWLPFSKQAPIG
ncbi:NAD(P)-binding domain-containing protein [Roseobacter sp. HKCCD9010]|uniref:NAD(P)-binding domain-containing protein n=1 Tax=unclassified Roseobacter TaxID=196798 RepID=UPI0019EA2028|nr:MULTISPECIES: NAD(P)-binding domain-containing protein [unclassified Roseobacter]MBF9051824.1 NAD(P)-binding domain-containing protein [Rhodobacterales bacterium HKCCD4356]NNV13817.1 NAD(P)-binding domain-containing protein [Roseobacter sp. HKCCD7357]NNV17842.1 NAD(P)-binding domain-containing protein [Roseobacter sp. HKCCD8768]NNV27449.1 NAD(P)-binding domain-containing protein [Roseobacter sp. HKCCD8192]NNV31569.1 NAD(P)-binding domain-containing protein [Roseobacter sp. HKCCD9061]